MKTIEERIKEIKSSAECAVCTMTDHKLPWMIDNGSFNGVINEMQNAQNKDLLGKAYHTYINMCICNGYSDGEIIAGIMQNEEQNKKFNVNIESVIKSLIDIRDTSVKLTESAVEKPVQKKSDKEEKSNSVPVADGKNASSNNDKTVKRIHDKLDYFVKLRDKIMSGHSTPEDLDKIKKVASEAKELLLVLDRTVLSESELKDIENTVKSLDNMLESMEQLKAVVNNQKAQAAVAHTANGFNIANFIKEEKGPVVSQPVQQEPAKPKTAFPHQICGLTDQQIFEEIGKHYKLCQPNLPAYPLYDLINNRLLAKKMKSLDAKQRANNPYLTQVDINEYIDVPELLEQYNLCFTIPCNNKKEVIVVLFNPTPAAGKDGVVQYPLHIFKATKTNNK